MLSLKNSWGRILAVLLSVFAFSSILTALTYWSLKDNIHVVISHQIYRSAELSRLSFVSLIRKEHIRSIINLRGENTGDQWYQAEIKTAKQLGVFHYDITFHAYTLPPKKLLQQLVSALKKLPRPILLHCMGGSDRTGMASAFALILNGASLKVAQQQYSMYYFVIRKDSIAKLVFPYYVKWLQQQHLLSNRQNFLRWIALTHY